MSAHNPLALDPGVSGESEAVEGALQFPEEGIETSRLAVVTDDPLIEFAASLTRAYAAYCLGLRAQDVLIGDEGKS